MSKTIIVVGFGPGISTGVAEKFGAEGFNVALVGRNKERLDAGVAALQAKGVTAAAFPADAGNAADIGAVVGKVRASFGPITAIHWNAYGGADAGDFLTADAAAMRSVFDVAITGLIATVQAALPDLKAAGDGAVLITNGAFGDLNVQIDEAAANSKNMGLALANASKHKLTRLLAVRLKNENVHVGEVMIAGSIKGTPWATNNPNAIDPATVGDKFFALYRDRSENFARLS